MKKSQIATPREKVIYRSIAYFYGTHGSMPTIQEVADRVKRSRTTVHEQVHNLIRKGYLTSQGTTRGLEFTDKGRKEVKTVVTKETIQGLAVRSWVQRIRLFNKGEVAREEAEIREAERVERAKDRHSRRKNLNMQHAKK